MSINFNSELDKEVLLRKLSSLRREVIINMVEGKGIYAEKIKNWLSLIISRTEKGRITIKKVGVEFFEDLLKRFPTASIISIETAFENRLRFVGWMIGKLEKLILEAICIAGNSLEHYELPSDLINEVTALKGVLDLYVLPGFACYVLGRMFVHLVYHAPQIRVNIIDALEAENSLEKFEYDGFPVVVWNDSKVVLNETPESMDTLINRLAKVIK